MTHRALGNIETSHQEEDCVVCLQAQSPRGRLLPCGHASFCFDCCQKLARQPEPKCPLCRTAISSLSRDNGYVPCGSGCHLCRISEKATTHSCHKTKKVWQINSPIDCNTRDVVYKLSCRKCPSFCYIGETDLRFCDVVAYKYHGYIDQKKLDHPVGRHFSQPEHSVADLLPLAFEQVQLKGKQSLYILRKSRASYWIQQYGSDFHVGKYFPSLFVKDE